MEAVRESHVPPHFRHTRPLDCDQQEALRKAAIGLIEQFAEDAQRDGRPYEVTFRCETCHRLKLQQDLAVPGTTITTDDEETLPPLRLVASLGTRALILNLVIGNEPDPEIEDIRQYFDIPVLTLKVVSFDSLQYLRSGFIAEGGINTSGLCRECEGLRDGERSREDRSLPDREEAQEMLEWMISQDCTQPMEPVEIPFEFLPEEIQAELLNLPQGYRDPVSLKLCSQCSMPAIPLPEPRGLDRRRLPPGHRLHRHPPELLQTTPFRLKPVPILNG